MVLLFFLSERASFRRGLRWLKLFAKASPSFSNSVECTSMSSERQRGEGIIVDNESKLPVVARPGGGDLAIHFFATYVDLQNFLYNSFINFV